MSLGEWLAAWGAMHRRPSRYDVRHLAQTVEETVPDDEDDARYLQGVADTLEWVQSGDVAWESTALVATSYRRAGFDELGRHESEDD